MSFFRWWISCVLFRNFTNIIQGGNLSFFFMDIWFCLPLLTYLEPTSPSSSCCVCPVPAVLFLQKSAQLLPQPLGLCSYILPSGSDLPLLPYLEPHSCHPSLFCLLMVFVLITIWHTVWFDYLLFFCLSAFHQNKSSMEAGDLFCSLTDKDTQPADVKS